MFTDHILFVKNIDMTSAVLMRSKCGFAPGLVLPMAEITHDTFSTVRDAILVTYLIATDML